MRHRLASDPQDSLSWEIRPLPPALSLPGGVHAGAAGLHAGALERLPEPAEVVQRPGLPMHLRHRERREAPKQPTPADP